MLLIVSSDISIANSRLGRAAILLVPYSRYPAWSDVAKKAITSSLSTRKSIEFKRSPVWLAGGRFSRSTKCRSARRAGSHAAAIDGEAIPEPSRRLLTSKRAPRRIGSDRTMPVSPGAEAPGSRIRASFVDCKGDGLWLRIVFLECLRLASGGPKRHKRNGRCKCAASHKHATAPATFLLRLSCGGLIQVTLLIDS